jgi:hypothetical protein
VSSQAQVCAQQDGQPKAAVDGAAVVPVGTLGAAVSWAVVGAFVAWSIVGASVTSLVGVCVFGCGGLTGAGRGMGALGAAVIMVAVGKDSGALIGFLVGRSAFFEKCCTWYHAGGKTRIQHET